VSAGDQRKLGHRGPGANARTQCERLVAWAHGGGTLHQDDWFFAPAPDGGSAIKAVRSRISQLESEGFGFHHTRRPGGSVEYRLAYMPERPAPRAPEPELPAVTDVDELPVDQLALELGEVEPPASSARAAA
jgi:hypothetical protein